MALLNYTEATINVASIMNKMSVSSVLKMICITDIKYLVEAYVA